MIKRYWPVLVLVNACGFSRNNPYDPSASGVVKMPGRISGAVIIEGSATAAGVGVVVTDAQNANVDPGLVTDSNGNFITPDLPPGVYSVALVVPAGNLPASQNAITVAPAETANIGTLSSFLAPANGVVTGRVALLNTSDTPQNVEVVLVRSDTSVAQTVLVLTDAAGNYAFTAVRDGAYQVRASKSGFTPDLASIALGGASRDAASPPDLKLYPASAVVQFSVNTANGAVIGAPFTNSTSVNLVMLAFGGVNQMRFSEDPNLVEGGQDVPFRDYVAEVPVTLSSGEGQKTIYAQFRVLDASSNEELRSDVYQTSVIYDATPPVLLTEVLDPQAVVHNGIRYLLGDSSAVPLEVTALDPYSRVAGIKVVVENADPTTIPFTPVLATDATVDFTDVVSLSSGDGTKTVSVQLIDGAGNTSALFPTTLVIDTTPPVLLANPAVYVQGAVAGQLNSLTVPLQFAVGSDPADGIDGPILMRYGLGDAPPAGDETSFFPQVSLQIQPSDAPQGTAVHFYGAFQDNAGNEIIALSNDYTVNLLGTLTGTVYLQGVPDTTLGHGGTHVTVLGTGLAIDPSTDTLSNGAYTIANVPVGTFAVQIAHTGATTLVRSPVAVNAGQTTALGVDRLILQRGDLTGVYYYGDQGPSGNNAGIGVTATSAGTTFGPYFTDNTGTVILPQLPVAAYAVHASANGYVAADTQNVAVAESPALNLISEVLPPPAPPALPVVAPITLAKFLGDFKICDQGDTTLPPKNCAPILYTNKSQILLGIDRPGTTYIRYVVQDPTHPGASSFNFPNAVPGDPAALGGTCSSSPAEQCWNTYDPAATDYLVAINQAQPPLAAPQEGQQTVLLQIADGSGPQLPLLQSQIVYDVTAPLAPLISIAPGPSAVLSGYTNSLALVITPTATATKNGQAASDASPLKTVEVSESNVFLDAGTDRIYDYGNSQVFTVTAGDGIKTVYAWFCDAAGNCNSGPVSTTIVLDTQPPSRTNGVDIVPAGPAITLQSGRQWWTRSANYAVDISLGASPAPVIADAVAYQLSLSQQFIGATWQTIDVAALPLDGAAQMITTSGIPLVPIDSSQIVYAEFMDAAGNISVPEVLANELTLTLDTVPPGGTVQIENGAAYTNKTPNLNIELTTDAVGGATQIQSTWTGILPDPNTGARQVYATAFIATPPAGDGTKTMLVRFFDPAGNYSERQSSIFLDTTPPAATASVNCQSCTTDSSGNLYYKDINGLAALGLFATDNSGIIDHAVVKVDANAPFTVPYAPLQTITISNVAGPHLVTVTYFDPATNSRAAPAITLSYDRTIPVTGNVSIKGTAQGVTSTTYTSTPVVQLAFSGWGDANSGLGSVLFSESPVFSGANWQSCTAGSSCNQTLNYTLSPGDGPKTIYAEVQDLAGNISTVATSASILLDTTPPTLSATLKGTLIGGGTSLLYASSTAVTVQPVASDAGSGLSPATTLMEVANTSDFSGATWGALGNKSWPLATGGDGTRTAYVAVRDLAGNVAVSSASIIVDTTPPYFGSVAIDGGVGYVNNQSSNSHTLSLDAQDSLTPVATMSIANSGSGGSAATGVIPFSTSRNSWALASGSGPQTVVVTFGDSAGNTSSANAVVIADTQNPSAVSFTVNPSLYATNNCITTPQWVSSTGLQLNLAGTDDVGISQFQISENSGFAGATWLPWPSPLTQSYVASSGDGAKTLYMRVQDYVGNKVQSNPVCVTLDTTPPTWVAPLSASAWAVKTTAASLTYSATDNLAAQSSLNIVLGQIDQTAGGVVPNPINCSALVAHAYGAPLSITSPSDGHFYQFYACIKDPAGNYSAPQQAPWPVVKYDLTPPPAPSVNQPSALASGALISWNGYNPDNDSSYYEVDYALDPNFLTGLTQLTTGKGSCGTGQVAPTSYSVTGLQNGINYWFRVLAFDCAGNSSTPPINPSPNIVTATPGIGTRSIPGASAGLVNLFSYGPDLWAHYVWSADSTFNGEVIRHCNAGSNDCQVLGNWDYGLAPITNQPNFNPNISPPTMIADDNTLFLITTVFNGSTSKYDLTTSWCGRETDCTQQANWSQFVIRSLSGATYPTATASDRYLAVAYGNGGGNSPTFSISKCVRHSTGTGLSPTCRSAPEWAGAGLTLDSIVPIDADHRLTAPPMNDGALMWGYESAAYTTPGGATSIPLGWPGSMRCEGFCENVTSACDGSRCSDLYFNNYLDATPNIDALPPVFSYANGMTIAAWREINYNVSSSIENVLVRKCTGTSECLNATFYTAAVTIASQTVGAQTRFATPNLAISNLGVGLAKGLKTRVVFPQTHEHELVVSTCDVLGSGGGCTATGDWQSAILLSGTGADAPVTAVSVGQNQYISSHDSTGGASIVSPTVAAPYGFFAGPLLSAVQLNWLPAESSNGTNVYYGSGAPWANQFSLTDPYTGSTTLALSSAAQTTVASFTGEGTSDSDQPWTVNPFAGQPGVVTTLPASALQMSIASATQGNNGTDDYRYAAVLANGTSTQGEMLLSQCTPGTDCTWGAPVVVNGNGAWNTIQMSLDYPRSYQDGTIIASTKPRIFIGARWSGSTEWVQTCDVNAGSCNVPGWSELEVPSINAASGLNLTTTGNITNTSNQITTLAAISGTHGTIVGNIVTGAGIAASTTVVSVTGATATLNRNVTATTTGVSLTFTTQPVALDSGANGTVNASSTTTSTRAVGDYVMTTAVRDNGQVIVDYCDGSPVYPHNGCAYAGSERATNYCSTLANWHHVELGNAGVYTGSGLWSNWGESVTGMPHPTYGWMAVQANPNSATATYKYEVGIWTCPYGTWGGGCSVSQNDCTNPSNWTYIKVPAVTSGAIGQMDITASTRTYYPITNAEDLTSAVYLSYYDQGWRVARCRETSNPLYDTAVNWTCAATGPSNDAKGWTTTPIAPTVFTPLSSTVRVINGDVVVMFMESQRIGLAICPQGANCETAGAWNVMTSFNGPIGNFAFGAGLLSNDIGNGLYLAYPLSGNNSLNFLTGGQMHGP